MKPDRSLRWWGLLLTGAGAMTTLLMVVLIGTGPVYGTGFLFAPDVLLVAGFLLFVGGLVALVVDTVRCLTAPRPTEPGRKPPRSLRQVALVVTGISAGITLAASLLTWIVEEIDDTHPIGQIGWLAFPAGFVTAGGLVVLLGEAVRAATSTPSGQEAAEPHRAGTPRSPGVVRAAVLALVTYLLLGALGVIALGVLLRAWGGLYQGMFLLLCAAAFFRGARRPQMPPGPPGPGTHSDQETGREVSRRAERQSLRQWALALTGGGAGIALTMFLFGVVLDRLYNTGVAIGPGIFAVAGLQAAAAGLLLLLVDGIVRRAERRQ